MAGFYFNRGQYAQAAEMFRRVTELAPDSARAFSNLGATYHQMDRLEDALTAYRKSLGIEPTSMAYSNLGTTEFFLGQYAEASRDFEKAVALTPERYDGWADLADAYYWSGQRGMARVAYERAIRLARSDLQINARNPSARARLAVCLARTEDRAGAREQIGQALALSQRDPRVFYDTPRSWRAWPATRNRPGIGLSARLTPAVRSCRSGTNRSLRVYEKIRSSSRHFNGNRSRNDGLKRRTTRCHTTEDDSCPGAFLFLAGLFLPDGREQRADPCGASLSGQQGPCHAHHRFHDLQGHGEPRPGRSPLQEQGVCGVADRPCGRGSGLQDRLRGSDGPEEEKARQEASDADVFRDRRRKALQIDRSHVG